MTDYSSLSDEELLDLYNQQQAQPTDTQTDYSSMSDAELLNAYNQQQGTTEKISTGLPLTVMHNQPKPEWTDLPKNILPDIGNVAKNIGQMVTHPIETGKALSKLIPTDAIRMLPGLQGVSAVMPQTSVQDSLGAWGGVWNDLKSKWGSKENIKNYLIEHPVQAAMDVSTVLTGVGGGLNMAGKLPTVAKAISTTGKAIDPINAIVKSGETALDWGSKIAAVPPSILSGAGFGAYMEALKNHPGFRKGISGAVSEEDFIGQMSNKLSDMTQSRANEYQNALQNVKGATQALDVAPIEKTLADRFRIFGLKLEKELPEELQGINLSGNADVANEALSGAKTTLNTQGARGAGVADIGQMAHKAFEDFKAVGDYTPYGLDTLRMNLQAIAQDSAKARNMLRPVIENIRKSVEDVVPGYRKMLGDYETATNKINELQKSLNIRGEGVSKDTAIRKINTIFRDVNKYRLDKLNELDPTGELRAIAAGLALKSGMPRGQLTRMLGMGGVGGAAFWLHNIPLAATEATLSSPRLMGETFNAIGKVGRGAKALTPAITPSYYTGRVADDVKNSSVNGEDVMQNLINKYAPLLSPQETAKMANMSPIQRQGYIAKAATEGLQPVLMTIPEAKTIIMSNKAMGKPVFDGIPSEILDKAIEMAENARAVASTQAQTFKNWLGGLQGR